MSLGYSFTWLSNSKEENKMSNEVQVFENEEFGSVRSILINGDPWFVGKDIAGALGYKNVSEALQDHVPSKYKLNSKTLSSLCNVSEFGQRGSILINEAGLYKLVLKSKLPSAEKFSDWCCEEVLPSIRKIGKYEVKQQEPKGDIKQFSEFPISKALMDAKLSADIMVEYFSVDKGIALAKSISDIEKSYNVQLTNIKSLIPPTTEETGYLTPTKIGEQIGMSSRKVNKLLESQGFQYKECGEWHLTGKGKQYGEKFPYENNGHSGYQIRWHKDIINVLDIQTKLFE